MKCSSGCGRNALNNSIYCSECRPPTRIILRNSIEIGNAVGDSNITIVGKVVVADELLGVLSKAEISDDLRASLQELTGLVTEMVSQPSADHGEAAIRNLRLLIGEALSPKPRKGWLELSAAGLVEASTILGEFGTRVKATVERALTQLL